MRKFGLIVMLIAIVVGGLFADDLANLNSPATAGTKIVDSKDIKTDTTAPVQDFQFPTWLATIISIVATLGIAGIAGLLIKFKKVQAFLRKVGELLKELQEAATAIADLDPKDSESVRKCLSELDDPINVLRNWNKQKDLEIAATELQRKTATVKDIALKILKRV